MEQSKESATAVLRSATGVPQARGGAGAKGSPRLQPRLPQSWALGIQHA